MVALDGFKLINDINSHEKWDYVFVKVEFLEQAEVVIFIFKTQKHILNY